MKAFAATAAVGLALAAGGCARDVARPTLTKLDCPENESGLRRVSEAADGKSCGYVSSDGAEITLKIIPVVGGVEATLKGLETELRTQMDAAAAAPAGTEGDTAPVEAANASATAASDAAAVIAQAQADAGGGGGDDAASVEADASPGSGADADWGGDFGDEGGGRDHARIDLPGVHIDARDEQANVRIGPLHIDAQDGGAIIRMQRDVRLRGEALSREKRGVRATFVLAGDEAPAGYKFAGYEAGGPRKGPLVVAIVKGDSADHEEIYDGVKKLVRKNGGV